MRQFAGIGIMLLGLAGCQSLPALIRIEVDGTTLEFKKKPPAPETPETPTPAEGGEDAPGR